MNFASWYTDTMDVLRVVDVEANGLTKQTREKVGSNIPCRIYQSSLPPITMQDTAAEVRNANKLMCPVETDLRKGDELLVKRGALVDGGGVERCFVGDIQDYLEPFGAVLPGLAHKQASISGRERV